VISGFRARKLSESAAARECKTAASFRHDTKRLWGQWGTAGKCADVSVKLHTAGRDVAAGVVGRALRSAGGGLPVSFGAEGRGRRIQVGGTIRQAHLPSRSLDGGHAEEVSRRTLNAARARMDAQRPRAPRPRRKRPQIRGSPHEAGWDGAGADN